MAFAKHIISTDETFKQKFQTSVGGACCFGNACATGIHQLPNSDFFSFQTQPYCGLFHQHQGSAKERQVAEVLTAALPWPFSYEERRVAKFVYPFQFLLVKKAGGTKLFRTFGQEFQDHSRNSGGFLLKITGN